MSVDALIVDLAKPFNEEGRKAFLENIYYASSAIVQAEVSDMAVTLHLSEAVDRQALHADVSELATRTAKSSPKKGFKVVRGHDGAIHFDKDPYETLVERREVVPTDAGVFVFQGEFLNRLKAMDSVFRSYALGEGSTEQFLPVTVPVSSLQKAGYLKSFPQHAYFSAPVDRDFQKLKHVSDVADEGAVAANNLAGSDRILSPTVCYHCFESLRDVDLDGDVTITAVNQCHRHELKNAQSLTRLQTYTMRELVFYGSADYVEERRQAVLEHLIALLSAWDMRYKVVVASDPFFASGAEVKKAFQLLTASKLEVQAYLPYDDRWIAIGSFNNHQQTLTEPYNIRRQGEATHSGCVGYGYERLLFSLYCQKGFDASNWPADLSGAPAPDGPAI